MSQPVHEWNEAYAADASPPWDIGRPQRAFLALAERGLLAGTLLDAGCGTGEHALLAASHGADATGVDLSPLAIERARAKADRRGLSARFVAGDILTVPLPEARFDVVLDSGLFHSFTDADRPRYVAVLARALRPGGRCYLACFSDRQPGDWGPRRVRRDELEAAFADGWTLDAIEPTEFEVSGIPDVTTAQAWLTSARRT